MTSTARRSKVRIPAPRKHGPDFSVQQTWSDLSANIREIQNHNAANLSFEENHRFAYNMVLYRHGETLYNGVKDLVSENLNKLLQDQVVPVFPSGTSDPLQRSNEAEYILKALREIWDDHQSSMNKLGQILKYMDRVYTKTAEKPETPEMGLALFVQLVFRPHIKEHLVAAILNQIEYEREGYDINRSAVKGCVDVFISLHNTGSRQTIYKDDLEPSILAASREFYSKRGNTLISSCDAPEYLRRVEKAYEDEQSRAHHYLSSLSAPALSQILDDHLLTAHLLEILEQPNSGLDAMIDNDKLEDLARLYGLFNKVPQGLKTLRRALKDSIVRRGDNINQNSLGVDTSTLQAPASPKGKGKAKAVPTGQLTLASALKWVQDVLDIKDKFHAIWSQAFDHDRELDSGLNEAFGDFVNHNAQCSEFISLFIDDSLKRGLKGKTDVEIESILDKTITVFRFLGEKDVFERYYKSHLAKRLLQSRSVSDDAERGMLAKLKIECGTQFTQKLEGMFHDMKVSSDTMEAYKQHLNAPGINQPDVEMSVIVGTSTFWPISQTAMDIIIPPILETSRKHFEQFYFSRHSGRRLTWQYGLGNADVKVAFNSRKHELNVSTYALIILLLFEGLPEGEFLEYQEIRDRTGIDAPELKRNLQSLACARFKVLRKHPAGRDVDDRDSFSFNSDFHDKMQKIKISTVSSKVESSSERKETMDRVDEERNFQTEACIVRVMKARKTMSYTQLINEVTPLLAQRFQPNPADIKKRLESLIERDYLERCPDKKSYNYVA
ncbi:Cullin-domain-containing protein [Cylindrobasidium torrendii FP15055 ss-10]|uniref:Cullin-domain-containing protein n=1 Tax=Cylindrobasidium torrendii FP15055 ss-10 TaxID=1314674 RepID=A0A0D7BQ90_9AGAR|nr:Cullin-domain-containing protein [Cylindrobasidium torrendii FP15055 ss-10]